MNWSQKSAMKILNFGSLNIDKVYEVDSLVRPGETITSRSFKKFCGGKGLNQSIALASAGAVVHHAGKIGKDGLFLKAYLEEAGVDVSNIDVTDGPTGHAIIQVNRNGENSIILFGGANHKITGKDVNLILRELNPGDYLLLQNEISVMPEILRRASEAKLKIVFNPAPMEPGVLRYPLKGVKYFIMNEIEGEGFTGEREPEQIISNMLITFPDAAIVLTLGENGVHYADSKTRLFTPAKKVATLDTTGAGDAFVGYFVAGLVAGRSVEKCLHTANQAAAICVTKPGAADSIPKKEEVSRMRLVERAY
jgi:ribokinase